jgi:TRAP-type C4-dicarboxylate transport system substrate-binding protein
MEELHTSAEVPDLTRRNALKFGVAAGAAATLWTAAPALGQRARAFRFGHMLSADTLYHKTIELFAEETAKLTSGKIKIEVYPASQLGTIPEMLSQTQVGSLTMTMAVPAWYSNFMKPVDVFTLPFLVSSVEKLKASLDGRLGTEVARLGNGVGFQVLGYWLKLRVINSQVYIQAFRALGASTVAMDPSELYVALQQGIVDGFEYPLPDLISAKLHEVSKFLSLDAHTTDFFIVSINKGVWDGLSAEERGALTQAMKAAMDFQWREQPLSIAAARDKLKMLLQVNEISEQNKQLFVEKTRPLFQQFENSIGKEFLALAVNELA